MVLQNRFCDPIFLGTTLKKRALWIQVKDLMRHLWLKGVSRSGKTAFLSGLEYQLLGIAARSQDLSIVKFDHKGDTASLYNFLETANELGIEPVLLTPVPGLATHLFNPLLQNYLVRQSPLVRGEKFAEALGVRSSSVGHGEAYWGTANEDPLIRAMESVLANFSELEVAVTAMSRSSKDLEVIRYLTNVLSKMKRVPFMNQIDPKLTHHQFQIDTLFKKPTAVYVFAPSIVQPDLVYTIVRFMLNGILLAAQEQPEHNRMGVIVSIDEAAKVASKSIDTFLDQAAGLNCGCILSHQHSFQLQTAEGDFSHSYRCGCSTRIDFTPSLHPDEHNTYGPEVRDWRQSVSHGQSYSQSMDDNYRVNTSRGHSSQRSKSEYERPLYRMSDLRKISARNNACLIDTTHKTSYGWGQFPMVMQSYYHVPQDTHLRRNRMSPPSRIFAPGMIVNPLFGEQATTKLTLNPTTRQSAQVTNQLTDASKSKNPTDTWNNIAREAEKVHRRVFKDIDA